MQFHPGVLMDPSSIRCQINRFDPFLGKYFPLEWPLSCTVLCRGIYGQWILSSEYRAASPHPGT